MSETCWPRKPVDYTQQMPEHLLAFDQVLEMPQQVRSEPLGPQGGKRHRRECDAQCDSGPGLGTCSLAQGAAWLPRAHLHGCLAPSHHACGRSWAQESAAHFCQTLGSGGKEPAQTTGGNADPASQRQASPSFPSLLPSEHTCSGCRPCEGRCFSAACGCCSHRT